MGMLSASRLLFHLLTYTSGAVDAWSMTYVRDNLALVNVITKLVKYGQRHTPTLTYQVPPLPLDPLLPDWDVLAKIYYSTVAIWKSLQLTLLKATKFPGNPSRRCHYRHSLMLKLIDSRAGIILSTQQIRSLGCICCPTQEHTFIYRRALSHIDIHSFFVPPIVPYPQSNI